MSAGNGEILEFYLKKSSETLIDAKILADSHRWNSCVNRLYYSCFYIVIALIFQKLAKRTKTHSGARNLFNEYFVKNAIVDKQMAVFYSILMDKRAKSDYDDFEIFTAEDVLPLISQAEEFINTIQKLIL
jgi:uncharacterized protein (UPF0332 family)